MSRPMVTVAASSRQCKTRTTGDAHLYRVVQYYDSWPFEPDFRVPYGSKSRRRTETFRAPEAGQAAAGACQRLRAVPAPERRGTGRRSWPWPSS